MLLRRGEGGDSAAFARAFEKRASADAWLLAPSQLEWRRLNSGSTSWAIKQQRFAPRCFRPAASYNDSCGRCCTLPGEVPVYSARGSAPAPAAEAAAAVGGATERHGAWPVPPRAGGERGAKLGAVRDARGDALEKAIGELVIVVSSFHGRRVIGAGISGGYAGKEKKRDQGGRSTHHRQPRSRGRGGET